MSTVSISISLIVMALDDFTGRPIEGNQIRAWIDGEKPQIIKPGGYRIFTNLQAEAFSLKLSGGQYLYQEIPFTREKLKQYEGGVFKVRMLPNRCYPIPADTTIIEGQGKPEQDYIILCREGLTPYKLLYAYEEGKEQISIFHPEHTDIEGKFLFICTKDSQEQEFFSIEGADKEQASTYYLNTPLKKSYKKIGTVIYPAYHIRTDEKGVFYLPVIGMKKEENLFTFYDAELGVLGEEQMIAGRVNRIMLE